MNGAWTFVAVSAALAVAIAVGAGILEYLGYFNVERQQALIGRMKALQDDPENVLMGCLDHIPLVLYINMDKSVARREWMDAQLVRACPSQKYRRVAGVKFDPKRHVLTHTGIMSNNEKGCMLAHFDAMKAALAAGVPYALILEDDASFHFSPWWPLHLQTIQKTKEWDMLRLNTALPSQISQSYPAVVRSDMLNTGMCAYLITREGMLKVREKTNGFTSTYQQDGMPLDVNMVGGAGNFQSFVTNKLYVGFRAVQESTIQPSGGVRWQWKRISEMLERVLQDSKMMFSLLTEEEKEAWTDRHIQV
jgi:GR25 family glycosyltransferase involved in LPS biosynthesis